MRSIPYRIMQLVITNLWGRHTHTHTSHMLQLACAWFKNSQRGQGYQGRLQPRVMQDIIRHLHYQQRTVRTLLRFAKPLKWGMYPWQALSMNVTCLINVFNRSERMLTTSLPKFSNWQRNVYGNLKNELTRDKLVIGKMDDRVRQATG